MSDAEIDRLGQEASSLLQSGKAREALKRLDDILILEPNHAKAWQRGRRIDCTREIADLH